MKTKRWVSLALALIMALGLALPALAYNTADFSDLPDYHWAYHDVMKMVDAGVVGGVGNGCFSPNQLLSKAQFVTMLGRIVLPDIEVTGTDWSGPYMAAAQELGWFKDAYWDGFVLNEEMNCYQGAYHDIDTTDPHSPITRYEAAYILSVIMEAMDRHYVYFPFGSGYTKVKGFADYDDILAQFSYHGEYAIHRVAGAEIMTGDHNNSFHGTGTLTRAEAAAILSRFHRVFTDASNTMRNERLKALAGKAWYHSSRPADYADSQVFSPNMEVTVEEFIGLVGQFVFSDIETDENDWCVPYVNAAKEAGWLNEANISEERTTKGISRYNMAEILFCAAKELNIPLPAPYTFPEIYEYMRLGNGDISSENAVFQVWSWGLMSALDRPDNHDNAFCGDQTMSWLEVAPIIDRFKALAEGDKTPPETVTVKFEGGSRFANATVGVYFKDGRLLGQTKTGQDGRWEVDITLPYEEYSMTEDWYYADLIGEAKSMNYNLRYGPSKGHYPSSILWEMTGSGFTVYGDRIY